MSVWRVSYVWHLCVRGARSALSVDFRSGRHGRSGGSGTRAGSILADAHGVHGVRSPVVRFSAWANIQVGSGEKDMSKVKFWSTSGSSTGPAPSVRIQTGSDETPRSLPSKRKHDEDDTRAIDIGLPLTTRDRGCCDDTVTTSMSSFSTARMSVLPNFITGLDFDAMALANGCGNVINQRTYDNNGDFGTIGRPFLRNVFLITQAGAQNHPDGLRIMSPKLNGECGGRALCSNGTCGAPIFCCVGQTLFFKYVRDPQTSVPIMGDGLILTTDVIAGPAGSSLNRFFSSDDQPVGGNCEVFSTLAQPLFGTNIIRPDSIVAVKIRPEWIFGGVRLQSVGQVLGGLNVIVFPRPFNCPPESFCETNSMFC
jgi:hypothetical protein